MRFSIDIQLAFTSVGAISQSITFKAGWQGGEAAAQLFFLQSGLPILCRAELKNILAGS
jgi:hypothetical protein